MSENDLIKSASDFWPCFWTAAACLVAAAAAWISYLPYRDKKRDEARAAEPKPLLISEFESYKLAHDQKHIQFESKVREVVSGAEIRQQEKDLIFKDIANRAIDAMATLPKLSEDMRASQSASAKELREVLEVNRLAIKTSMAYMHDTIHEISEKVAASDVKVATFDGRLDAVERKVG